MNKADYFNKERKLLKLTFSTYDTKEFKRVLSFVQSLDGRKYNPDGKYWTCPNSQSNFEQLSNFGFNMGTLIREDKEKEKLIPFNEIEIMDLPESLTGLFDYQKRCLTKIKDFKNRCLLSLEMGLGKTIISLANCEINEDFKKILIICPSSLKINWQRETEKWLTRITENDILIAKSRTPGIGYKNQSVIIINYDILADWQNFIINKFNPDSLIVDESTYCKSVSAQRSKALKHIVKTTKLKSFLALSGTPIMNRPIEIFPTLNIIDPVNWESKYHFGIKYCDGKHNNYGWDFSGASNLEELNKRLNESVMIRLKKSEVLKDLPPISHFTVAMEEDEKALNDYKKAKDNFLEWMTENEGVEKAQKAFANEQIVKMTKLKRLAYEVKKKAIIQWIKDYLEVEEKLVIFAYHREVLKDIMNEFKECSVLVDGSVKNEDRQKAVDMFQENPNIRLFVGQIRACGMGLTLTAANSTAHIEFDWVPANHEQASARVHRIGQKASKVNSYYLIAPSTIDYVIGKLLDKKRGIASKVIDGIEVDYDENFIKSIAKELKND